MLLQIQIFGQSEEEDYIYEDFLGGPKEVHNSGFRKVLNKFSLTVLPGYGRTFYRQGLKDVAFLERGTALYLLPEASNNTAGYQDFLNSPLLISPIIAQPGDRIIAANDSTAFNFTGSGYNLPISANLQFVHGKFRLGGGIAYEFHKLGTFEAETPSGTLKLTPVKDKTTFKRFFGSAAYRFYDYRYTSLAAEVKVGTLKRGKAFDLNYITEGGLTAELGINIEKNFSEYLRLVGKVAYEIKSYKNNIPELAVDLKTRQPGLYFSLGMSINFPEIRRCPIPRCRIQTKHVHGNKEYRGHPLTKIQTPGYGENHRKLLRYKRKNKKKINPF